ncbi:hypothetical protein A4D02_34640 [Niastella koreensis]|uniref:Uncharacterized protein n=2 Tax=Niastella koreensis TaxID=354356 RepID=G8TRS0_NIAKG|nr:hypothetical protein [Niastella koreensis]AEW02217.1 hypothetical protein Niako_5989 [Niastella koreensis GR20-10]OQP45091.1 hypothetical protein A4D02_34640 [Niastella koreensis]
MASAFWTLEDGRCFARPWSGMAYMLELITDELKAIKGAEEFYKYLETFVYNEEKGDTYNGYGGFFRGDEDIMFNFDLRTFAPQNREFFWVAAQKALTKLKTEGDDSNEGIVLLLTTLLDMHKRIKKGEDPMLLNHLETVEPKPVEKLGPGW